MGHAQSCRSYRVVFKPCVPHSTPVARPFHVEKLADTALDAYRRRFQNETRRHRYRSEVPLQRPDGACRSPSHDSPMINMSVIESTSQVRRTGTIRAVTDPAPQRCPRLRCRGRQVIHRTVLRVPTLGEFAKYLIRRGAGASHAAVVASPAPARWRWCLLESRQKRCRRPGQSMDRERPRDSGVG